MALTESQRKVIAATVEERINEMMEEMEDDLHLLMEFGNVDDDELDEEIGRAIQEFVGG